MSIYLKHLPWMYSKKRKRNWHKNGTYRNQYVIHVRRISKWPFYPRDELIQPHSLPFQPTPEWICSICLGDFFRLDFLPRDHCCCIEERIRTWWIQECVKMYRLNSKMLWREQSILTAIVSQGQVKDRDIVSIRRILTSRCVLYLCQIICDGLWCCWIDVWCSRCTQKHALTVWRFLISILRL